MKGGLATSCSGPPPGGVTADLFFQSTDTDAHLGRRAESLECREFSLTLATLDFSGAVSPSNLTLVWGDGFHNVKGASMCNAGGTSVGNGNDPCIIYNPKSSVPEPATLAMFGLGLFGLGLSRRKRAC